MLQETQTEQAMQRLVEMIRERKSATGVDQRLPSERQLERKWRVGRTTLNKAVACLIAQGHLRRVGYKLYPSGSEPALDIQLPRGDGSAAASVAPTRAPPPPIHVLQPPYGLAITHSPLEAAHDVAQSLGTHAIPLLSKSAEDQHHHLTALLRNGTNGFIVWPLPLTPLEALLRQFRAHGVPFVLCDLDLGPFDFVGVDNEQGTRLAVEHLHLLGHRRIMYVTQSLQIPSLQRRRDGYVQACLSRGLRRAARSVLEIESATELEQVQKALDAFRGQFRGTTAVVFSNDWAAIYFMKLAREAGIRVPEDVSVVGFDGIDAASITTPGLTTVEQNFHHTGVAATQLLFQLIENQRKGRKMPPYRLRVEPQLAVRQSTARRRAT